ncbi:hypothetical protein AL543_21515 [Vibrio mimicus]|nr:hypothetical protein AL543_21515 [Vibrio mimicus]
MLAAFLHPNHIAYLCLWGLTLMGVLTCRLPATPSSLGIEQVRRNERVDHSLISFSKITA